MKKHFLLLAVWMMTAASIWAQANITVAEALEIGATLSKNQSTSETYTITGYVNVIDENSFNTSYNNMTFWIADTQQSECGGKDKELQW